MLNHVRRMGDVNLITTKPVTTNNVAEARAAPAEALQQQPAQPAQIAQQEQQPVLPRDEWNAREQFVTKRFDARRALDDIEQRMNWRWGGGPIVEGQDNFPPIQAMYGATVGPIERPDFQPLYGAIVQPPPTDPPIQAMYGATITPPDLQPMYGAPIRPPAPDFQPMYGAVVRPPPFEPNIPPFQPWLPWLLPNPINTWGIWGAPGCGPGLIGGHDHLNHRQRDLASIFDNLWAKILFGF